MQCPKCGGALARSRRRGLERLIFSHTYRCLECNYRQKETYLGSGLLSEYATCPRCGNGAPDKRKKPDKVDSMLHTPLRLLHRMMGGNLYHCIFCRLQFYDFRKLQPVPPKPAAQRPVNRATMVG